MKPEIVCPLSERDDNFGWDIWLSDVYSLLKFKHRQLIL